MRAFLTALVAAGVIALAGSFALDKVQETSSAAYSTEAVRL
ncbi:MAG TPA: hypothetical protein VEK73_07255 [Xanthobacteraceae bacterium]|nr:hypothetical protein [Xanthobacteraceae bacterium]